MIISKAIFPTAYIGTIDYFAALISTNDIIFDIHEHYRKQTLRNRCLISSPNGVLTLSVPVIKTLGNHTPVKDMIINPSDKWQIIHWRGIEAAYNSSPFFLYYKDDLILFFRQFYKKLFDFNLNITLKIFDLMGHNIRYQLTDSYKKAYESITDFRESFAIKETHSQNHFPRYHQVFANKSGFIPNLSILDLLFNLGPETLLYLKEINISHIFNHEPI